MLKRFILFIILLVSIVGCTQKDVVNFDKDDTLVIEERVGDELSTNYEVINEINDEELVQEVINIFNGAQWETNVEVNMPREPDYKINKNYHIWVTPKGNLMEVVITENSYYVRLSENQSSKLWTLMTGN
jgi:hypothetical protein